MELGDKIIEVTQEDIDGFYDLVKKKSKGTKCMIQSAMERNYPKNSIICVGQDLIFIGAKDIYFLPEEVSKKIGQVLSGNKNKIQPFSFKTSECKLGDFK
jgi:hypothetical protein